MFHTRNSTFLRLPVINTVRERKCTEKMAVAGKAGAEDEEDDDEDSDDGAGKKTGAVGDRTNTVRNVEEEVSRLKRVMRPLSSPETKY